MSIKKATVNNRTRKVFMDMIENDFLKSDKIDMPDTINKFFKLEDEIRESLNNGEITFLKPDRVNDIKSYKTPFQIQSIRGMLIWNELYPESKISTPNKVNVLKLKELEYEELESIIQDQKILAKLKKYIFDNEDVSKYKFSTISLPKSITKIPDWIIPLINVKEIIDDNTGNGILLLQSLGVKVMEYNNKEYYSTFVDF